MNPARLWTRCPSRCPRASGRTVYRRAAWGAGILPVFPRHTVCLWSCSFTALLATSILCAMVANIAAAEPANDKPAAPGAALPTGKTADDRPPIVLTDAARQLHRQCLLIDGHNDLPRQLRTKGDSGFDKLDISQSQPSLDTDIARLRRRRRRGAVSGRPTCRSRPCARANRPRSRSSRSI